MCDQEDRDLEHCVRVCQVNSEPEEDCEECSKENLDQMCVDAREQLTNSIRLQWRRLKNHMHALDTQGVFKNHHSKQLQCGAEMGEQTLR